MATQVDGRPASARGVVIDVDFAERHLPAIQHVLLVQRPPLAPLTVEVQSHVSPVPRVACASVCQRVCGVVWWSRTLADPSKHAWVTMSWGES